MNLYDSEKKYELNLLHCNSPHDNHLCLRQCVEASEDKTEAETEEEDVEHLPLGVQDHHHLIMQDHHHLIKATMAQWKMTRHSVDIIDDHHARSPSPPPPSI